MAAESILAGIVKNPRLPTPAPVALKILEKVSRPDCALAEIASLVSLDPGLCANILQIVNSAFFTLPYKVGTINRALNLLGLKRVRRPRSEPLVAEDAAPLRWRRRADLLEIVGDGGRRRPRMGRPHKTSGPRQRDGVRVALRSRIDDPPRRQPRRLLAPACSPRRSPGASTVRVGRAAAGRQPCGGQPLTCCATGACRWR